MIDLPVLLPQVEIAQPQLVERRKRGSRATRAAIGTVILLGDGSRCVVVGHDSRGAPLCYGEAPEPRR